MSPLVTADLSDFLFSEGLTDVHDGLEAFVVNVDSAISALRESLDFQFPLEEDRMKDIKGHKGLLRGSKDTSHGEGE